MLLLFDSFDPLFRTSCRSHRFRGFALCFIVGLRTFHVEGSDVRQIDAF